MLKNFHKSFFPVPSFLEPHSFGLDISNESIKFVELVRTTKGIAVRHYGERKIPIGVIEQGEIKNPNKIEEILTELRKEFHIRSVRVSLPEEKVYLFPLKLAKEGLENIREAVELSLEEHVPIPPSEAVFDFDIVEETEKNLYLQVAVATEAIVDSYLSIFRNTKISVKSFELEGQAVARSVIKKNDNSTYMIVDFGKRKTGIFIVSRGVPVFTSVFDIGGATITEMLAKNFNISFEEAEKKKIESGLKRNPENTEVFSVLLNAVSVLRDELMKHSIYWHTHKDEEGKDRPKIKEIILCGGDSNLIGLAEYFSVSMKTKVSMANIWVNVFDPEKIIPDISFNESLSYAPALGLALGDFQ